MLPRALLHFALLCSAAIAAEPPIPPVPDRQPKPPFAPTPPGAGVHMLVPGFTVRELPVKLTSLNNIEYAPDGRLFAGGYDGRFHVLRDTDGDGLEDKVDTFSPERSANYPLGMAVKDGDLYVVLTDEIIRWRDTNGDGVPDLRETVVKGFDDPELVAAPYLNHRRVDSSMAIAFGPDGALYTTMGNAGYNNAYWHDKTGVAHYSPERRRGCLLRFGADGKVEQLATGLRYIMSLQFNQQGDLFGTDQEGATWVPNGNPFDELLRIEPGRHYGFPPRHPRWLPDVIDEPSVYDYMPQHESTCGFRFNGPAPGRGRFGPELWAGDAIVTGESRGKLWRTKLAKTAAGYVAQTQLIARLDLMAVDCAISPKGDLVVCCHTGAPDWGNGPQGEGRIFKISYTDPAALQPVVAFTLDEGSSMISFNREPKGGEFEQLEKAKIEAGHYVEAADRLETIRPGYAVVKMQQKQPRTPLAVSLVAHTQHAGTVVFRHDGPRAAVNRAVTIPPYDYPEPSIENGNPTTHHVLLPGMDVMHDLSGLYADWSNGQPEPESHTRFRTGPPPVSANRWQGWLPHPDLTAARIFTIGSAMHDQLWRLLETKGTLKLNGQIDLWQLLTPATQPLSHLDYEPPAEDVTVVFKSDAPLELVATANMEKISDREVRFTQKNPARDRWVQYYLTVSTPVRTLDVSAYSSRDPRPRALPTRRFLNGHAQPAPPDDLTRTIPEIAGGNYEAGHALFKGKATCANCHQLRGDGVRVGPELSNLSHRDYTSVLRDIANPNATINPDAVGYVVTLKDNTAVVGTRLAETATELQIAQPGGAVAKIDKANLAKIEPMTVSLMPTGLDKALTTEELRDLMTYLLTEPAAH